MNDPVIEILTQLKGIKWFAYLAVLTLIVIGIANFTDALRKIYKFFTDISAHFQDRQLTDEQLNTVALDTARALMEFVSERQAAEPNIDFENWNESTQAQIKYSQETQNIYYRDFGGKIGHYRNEFLKRGLSDKDINMFYEHPTNYIGMRTVAMKLAELAYKLENGI